MTLKEDLKRGKVDLNELPAGKADRVKRFLRGDKRALRKRDQVMGLRFSSEDITSWRAAADAAGMSISDWVEERLNEAAAVKK